VWIFHFPAVIAKTQWLFTADLMLKLVFQKTKPKCSLAFEALEGYNPLELAKNKKRLLRDDLKKTRDIYGFVPHRVGNERTAFLGSTDGGHGRKNPILSDILTGQIRVILESVTEYLSPVLS
jgi:hypothetical protein